MYISEVMGPTPNHPVVMNGHHFVLKPMVTRGSPILRKSHVTSHTARD